MAAFFFGLTHSDIHFRPAVAVKTIALNKGGVDAEGTENMFKRITGGRGAGTGGTGDGNNWIFV